MKKIIKNLPNTFIRCPLSRMTCIIRLGSERYKLWMYSGVIVVRMRCTSWNRSSLDLILPIRAFNFLLINNHIFSMMLISGDCAGQLIVLIRFVAIYSCVVLARCTGALSSWNMYPPFLENDKLWQAINYLQEFPGIWQHLCCHEHLSKSLPRSR